MVEPRMKDVDAITDVSPPMLPRDWQQHFEELLKDSTYHEKRPENSELAESLGVSMSTLEAMEAISRPEYLRPEVENIPKNLEFYDASVSLPDGIELSALKAARSAMSETATRFWSRSMFDHLPMWHQDFLRGKISTTPDNSLFQVSSSEVVLLVAVCDPTTDFEKRLTALRDKLCCASDERVLLEQSHNPELQATEKAKDRFKGGFFFIESTFYNDSREPHAVDLSEPLISWLKRVKLATVNILTDHINTVPMDEMTFNDLHLRLGFPYLYFHQGSCEHLIIFRDLRLFHHDDPQDIRLYPFLCFKSPHTRTVCCACHTMTARWMTMNDKLAPSTPCFFCQKCYMALHFNSNGQKLGDFKAYQYIDPNDSSLCPKGGLLSSASSS